MPPTFQSWFTITNLHIWLMTTRLRALPPPHGNIHIQCLIDHFFLDVEDRIRAVLQPIEEDPPQSSFYSAPVDDKIKSPKKKRGRAPDRLVSQQMRILKEQWTGLGMSFDLGLVRGDAELAAAIWRNLLGARGARGIPFPSEGVQDVTAPSFRRSVNPLGSSSSKSRIKLLESGLEAEEAKDDGSGVHDYPLDKIDKYVSYPQLMVDIIEYIRSELKRLEAIHDEDIIGRTNTLGRTGDGLQALKFRKM
jgi:cytochrome b pre-mRNA-processing protein 3